MVEWQPPVTIPLAAGLATKADKRALQPPGLAVCRNAQFDELGGIQKRFPFAPIGEDQGTNIVGGGTLANPHGGGGTLSDIRRIVPNGDELLCFTKDKLYSWSEAESAWVEKARYVAPEIQEEDAFVSMGEQIGCDRVEVGGVEFFAWAAGVPSGIEVVPTFVAARDMETGAVLLQPTQLDITASQGATRLVAVGSVAVLFWLSDQAGSNSLHALTLDPDDLEGSVAATETDLNLAGDFYDVVASTAGDLLVATSNGLNHFVARVTTGLSVTASTKARPSDGAIAIAEAPDGRIAVIRADDSDLHGDILAADLSDVHTTGVIDTLSDTPDHITAIFESKAVGSEYRCRVFWSANEGPTELNGFFTTTNTITTDNTIGTAANLVQFCGLASRPFEYSGTTYVWVVFASDSNGAGMGHPLGLRGALQNTYFLYDDAGTLIAKAAPGYAGGFAHPSCLPAVQADGDTFTWAGTTRRRVPLGENHSGYSARNPHAISVTFDSNNARRCERLGDTLYVTGGQILQYDGVGLTEVGFHIEPWYFKTVASGAPGNVGAGKYTVRLTWRWDNAKGERDRSTSATADEIELTSAGEITIQPTPLTTTLKTGPVHGEASIEIWRTQRNPALDAPQHLVTSPDPATSGDNAYFANDPTEPGTFAEWTDNLADEDIRDRESNPEAGGVLAPLPPPAASIIAATQDRLFLAGIAGRPHEIRYSRYRNQAEVASFNDLLSIELPPSGGDITALAFLQETLIAFKERAIYALPGQGFDNLGLGQNYGPVRVLSTDVGAVNAESVVLAPMGLVFKSHKGWYLLTGAQAPQYIGRQVADFDSDEVVAAHVMESQHQVRVVTTSRILVWDYEVDQWSEWGESGCVSATVWGGKHVIATSTSIQQQQSDHTATDYSLDIETAWFKPMGASGYFRLRRIMPLGEYRSQHDLRIRIAKDYLENGSGEPVWFDDFYYQVEPETLGGPLEVLHNPSQQKMGAVKIRLTDYTRNSEAGMAGEGLKLTALSFEWAPKRGVFRARAVPRRPLNLTPTASFTWEQTGSTVQFTDTSTDPDGTISGWSWTFTNATPATSTDQNPSITVTDPEQGVEATLEVTDNGGAQDTHQEQITLERPDVVATLLTDGGSTADGLEFSTASISPTPDRLLLAYVLTEGTTEAPTLTGNGLTWTKEATESNAGSGRILHVYSAIGDSPSAGAVTITFAADNARSIVWQIVECANVDPANPIVQVVTAFASDEQVTGTLATLENAHNAHVAGVSSNLGGGTTFTPDAAFAELADSFQLSNAITLETEWAINQTSCTPTCDDGVSSLAIISVEVKSGWGG